MHTPNPPFKPASLFRRIAAFIYDAFLVFSTLLLMTFFALLVLPSHEIPTHSIAFQLYLFFIIGGFNVWFWTHGGQTLGMLAWRFQVIDLQGQPIGAKKAIVRFFMACISLGCLGIGYLWILGSKKKQSLHDIVCKTQCVIKS